MKELNQPKPKVDSSKTPPLLVTSFAELKKKSTHHLAMQWFLIQKPEGKIVIVFFLFPLVSGEISD